MMIIERVQIRSLQIDRILYDFVNEEVLPGTNIDQNEYWLGVESIINDLTPENHRLLQKRNELQSKIDEWHRNHQGNSFDIEAYKTFLYDIGYLTSRTNNAQHFPQIDTTNVDEEISLRAAPQLVVPLMNARFTLNAANARWGSLYDALYGTDAIPESDGCQRTKEYNEKRGEKVIAFTRQFLDQSIPLANHCSHSNVLKYSIDENGELKVKICDSIRGKKKIIFEIN